MGQPDRPFGFIRIIEIVNLKLIIIKIKLPTNTAILGTIFAETGRSGAGVAVGNIGVLVGIIAMVGITEADGVLSDKTC